MTIDPHALPVLTVQHLTTRFASRTGTVTAVDDVSFTVRPSEIMGLVGESGSGKSMTGFSIMGLVDPPGQVAGGVILFKGRSLRGLNAEQMRQLRGNRIAMIFQDPMMSLNPVLRIDTQMVEAIRAHQKVGKLAAREMARDALARVGIAAPEERLRAYPHQFSGGMRQRVAIAIALLNRPDLIICDEPTTALDVTTQAQIVREMQQLCRESGTALIWITHDLALVSGMADSLCVMYGGRIVESGPARQVLEKPRHPYTGALLAAAPARHPPGTPLPQIEGTAPTLAQLPSGCTFRTRCPRATEICQTTPPVTETNGQAFRCFHPLGDA